MLIVTEAIYDVRESGDRARTFETHFTRDAIIGNSERQKRPLALSRLTLPSLVLGRAHQSAKETREEQRRSTIQLPPKNERRRTDCDIIVSPLLLASSLSLSLPHTHSRNTSDPCPSDIPSTFLCADNKQGACVEYSVVQNKCVRGFIPQRL